MRLTFHHITTHHNARNVTEIDFKLKSVQVGERDLADIGAGEQSSNVKV